MKALKILSYLGKIAGVITALDAIPFAVPKLGIIIFDAASILKDNVNRVGDLLDDGQLNCPGNPEAQTCKVFWCALIRGESLPVSGRQGQ